MYLKIVDIKKTIDNFCIMIIQNIAINIDLSIARIKIEKIKKRFVSFC